jgi:hypothetical protein
MIWKNVQVDMSLENATRNARIHGILDATLDALCKNAREGSAQDRLAYITRILRIMQDNLRKESFR